MQMAFSQKRIATGAIWTVATHGVSVAIRFIVNVILSRLVSPEVLGTLMVINTLKVGMELVTDVGIGQILGLAQRQAALRSARVNWRISARSRTECSMTRKSALAIIRSKAS